MSEKDIYREMVEQMRAVANNDLEGALQILDYILVGPLCNSLSFDTISYKRSELESLRQDILDKREFMYNVLIPEAERKMEECGDE